MASLKFSLDRNFVYICTQDDDGITGEYLSPAAALALAKELEAKARDIIAYKKATNANG